MSSAHNKTSDSFVHDGKVFSKWAFPTEPEIGFPLIEPYIEDGISSDDPWVFALLNLYNQAAFENLRITIGNKNPDDAGELDLETPAANEYKIKDEVLRGIPKIKMIICKDHQSFLNAVKATGMEIPEEFQEWADVCLRYMPYFTNTGIGERPELVVMANADLGRQASEHILGILKADILYSQLFPGFGKIPASPKNEQGHNYLREARHENFCALAEQLQIPAAKTSTPVLKILAEFISRLDNESALLDSVAQISKITDPTEQLNTINDLNKDFERGDKARAHVHNSYLTCFMLGLAICDRLSHRPQFVAKFKDINKGDAYILCYRELLDIVRRKSSDAALEWIADQIGLDLPSIRDGYILHYEGMNIASQIHTQGALEFYNDKTFYQARSYPIFRNADLEMRCVAAPDKSYGGDVIIRLNNESLQGYFEQQLEAQGYNDYNCSKGKKRYALGDDGTEDKPYTISLVCDNNPNLITREFDPIKLIQGIYDGYHKAKQNNQSVAVANIQNEVSHELVRAA